MKLCVKVLIVLALLLGPASVCSGAPFPASEIQFNSFFGTRGTDSLTFYCLLGSGFFVTPRSGAQDSLITVWLRAHPHAVATEVTRLDAGEGQSIIYTWISDGEANLNVFLISEGAFPGGVMMDAVETQELPKSSGQRAIDIGIAEAEAEEEASGKHVPRDDSKPVRLVTDDEYAAFILRVIAAEFAAKADRLGVWSGGSGEEESTPSER